MLLCRLRFHLFLFLLAFFIFHLRRALLFYIFTFFNLFYRLFFLNLVLLFSFVLLFFHPNNRLFFLFFGFFLLLLLFFFLFFSNLLFLFLFSWNLFRFLLFLFFDFRNLLFFFYFSFQHYFLFLFILFLNYFVLNYLSWSFLILLLNFSMYISILSNLLFLLLQSMAFRKWFLNNHPFPQFCQANDIKITLANFRKLSLSLYLIEQRTSLILLSCKNEIIDFKLSFVNKLNKFLNISFSIRNKQICLTTYIQQFPPNIQHILSTKSLSKKIGTDHNIISFAKVIKLIKIDQNTLNIFNLILLTIDLHIPDNFLFEINHCYRFAS